MNSILMFHGYLDLGVISQLPTVEAGDLASCHNTITPHTLMHTYTHTHSLLPSSGSNPALIDKLTSLLLPASQILSLSPHTPSSLSL